jgi:hypothetical protein
MTSMKQLLSSALVGLALFTFAAPALADRWDGHRDADYSRWQHGHHRFRHWHGRDVTYWNGRWGYWAPRGGVHVFVNVPL